jgi:transposase
MLDMTYSMDLRRRVVDAAEQSPVIASVAKQFNVDPSTVRDWVKRHEQNQLESCKPGPKKPRKLSRDDDALICRKLKENPGITANELIPMLSEPVVESTVCRAMKRLGFRLKKVPDRRRARST